MTTMRRAGRTMLLAAVTAATMTGCLDPEMDATMIEQELDPASPAAACALRAGRAQLHEGLDDYFFSGGGDADGTTRSYVNPCSGNLLLQGDFAGHSLLLLSYNSAEASRTEVAGSGWRLYANSTLAAAMDGSVTITWGDGAVTRFVTGPGGYVSPRGLKGQLTGGGSSFTLRMQGGTRFVFEGGLLVRSIDRNENVTTINRPFPNKSLVGSIVDADGRTWSVAYSAGRIASMTDPAGRAVGLVYSGAGDLVEVRFPAIGGVQPVTQLTYDGTSHLPILERSPAGTTRGFSFFTNRRLRTARDRDGVTVRADYFPTQTVIKDGFGDRDVLCFQGDGVWGKLVSWKDPAGRVERYVRDADGFLEQWIDRNGDLWQYTNDAAGNRTSERDPAGNVKTWAWDARGNLTSCSESGATTSYTYDANDQLTSIAGPVPGEVQTYAVDARGNHLAITDFAGVERARMTYDARGRTRTLTQNGSVWSWTYDARGFIASYGEPGVGTTSYTNNAMGQVLRMTDPFGNVHDYSYDAWGRFTGVVGPDSTISETLDRDGNLLSATMTRTSSVSDTYAYDSASRLRATTHNAVPVLISTQYNTFSAPAATASSQVCE